MNIKNLGKKALLTVGMLQASFLPALAAGEEELDPIVKVDNLKSIFTEAQTNMTSLLAEAIPVVIAFVAGGLLIWGALALVSLLKRGFGAGKGR